MDSINNVLAEALTQSEQMLELAKESDWEQVETIQKQHVVLINRLVATTFDDTDISQVRATIQKIQSLDQETEQLASQRKDQIVKEKQQQDKGDKMKKAFGEFK